MTPPGHDNDNRLCENDLQAFVDGQLEVRRLAAVETYLADHRREAARVAAYRLQIAGLHALFGPRPGTTGARTALPPAIAALACELDAHLRRPMENAVPPGRQAPVPGRLRAAAIALLLAAGAAGGVALAQSLWRDDPLVATSAQPSESPLQATAPAPDKDRNPLAGEARQPLPATQPARTDSSKDT